MALLEAVVFPQDHQRRLPCCRSCGTKTCVLCGYGIGIAGELEGVHKMGVKLQDGEDLVAATPHMGAATTWAGQGVQPTTLLPSSTGRPVQRAVVRRRRRRRRAAGPKEARNVEDAAETQRLNHIVVERNRRRKMNQYLATLRALMPRSYARRGDQASIVGGAINFVKELEHRLHSLHAEQKRRYNAAAADHRTDPFASLFTSPQCSVSAAADVEAAVSDRHATVKVLAPRRPGQQLLLRLLLGMQLRGLAALHLNVTTVAAEMVFYTITVRMGEGCQLSSADDVVAVVHDIVAEANTAEERAKWLPPTR